jgi:hypothetical protein
MSALSHRAGKRTVTMHHPVRSNNTQRGKRTDDRLRDSMSRQHMHNTRYTESSTSTDQQSMKTVDAARLWLRLMNERFKEIIQ